MSNRKAIRVLAGAVLTLSCFGQESETFARAKRIAMAGEEAFWNRNYAAAERRFRESYNLVQHPLIAYYLTCTFMETGRASETLDFANQALNGRPRLDEAYRSSVRQIITWAQKTQATGSQGGCENGQARCTASFLSASQCRRRFRGSSCGAAQAGRSGGARNRAVPGAAARCAGAARLQRDSRGVFRPRYDEGRGRHPAHRLPHALDERFRSRAPSHRPVRSVRSQARPGRAVGLPRRSGHGLSARSNGGGRWKSVPPSFVR